MNKPVYPTIPQAYVFQEFANVNWKLYGNTNGKHMGVDIGVTSGKPGADIYAVYDGVVVESGYYDAGGYGRRIVIEHETGKYKTLYAHLQNVFAVAGDRVRTGQKIGTMGGNIEDKYRGASGGTHLHFEVILSYPIRNAILTSKGYTVDPFPWLMEHYGILPIGQAVCVSRNGMNVRAEPRVAADVVKVGTINYKDSVYIMEITEKVNGDQWARRLSLRPEWFAVEYKGLPYFEIRNLMPAPAPQPEPEDEEGEPPQAGYEAIYNQALDDVIAAIQVLRKK